MVLFYPSISQERLALGHAPGKINGQINLETLNHTVCLLKIHNERMLRTSINTTVQVKRL